MSRLRDHPQRYALTEELHARPVTQLQPPERVSHFALLSGEGTVDSDRSHLATLCERFDVAPPPEGATHFSADCGRFRLKWERHTECTTYTFFRHGPFGDPFAQPASSLVPRDWLAALPGQLLVAVNLALASRDSPDTGRDRPDQHFMAESLCGSLAAGGAARLWADFRIHEDGFSRILVRDVRLGQRQAGRLVQRLLEIETYRTIALLALPLARETVLRVGRIDQALAELTERMHEMQTVEDDRHLLGELSELSADIERIAAATGYRFGAAKAYNALVEARIAELREQRVEGLQTIGEFMARRLAPAMRTCESVAGRQEVLSTRASRAGNLLRTRVDIAVEGQNRDLLASMNRRAKLQLRLQQTVEGLSVVAITYYLVSLVGYVLTGIEPLGVKVDPTLGRAAAIPVVAALAWLGVRRIRRAVMKDQDDSD